MSQLISQVYEGQQPVVGKNKISRKQIATYQRFILDNPGILTSLLPDRAQWDRVAKHGFSSIEHGKVRDQRFCAAWDRWAEGKDIPKSHKWIKGLYATAICLGW